MATLASLVAEIVEDLKKYNVTNDLAIDLELVADKIVEANLSVLNKFYASKMPLEGFYQIVGDIPVVCQRDTCTIGNFKFTDKTVYYKAELPPLVKFIGDANIGYFGMLGYDQNLSRLDILDFISRRSARYTKRFAIYTMMGDIAVMKNIPEGFSAATGVFILEDPRTAPGWDDETSNFPTASVESVKIIVKNSITQTPLLPDLVGGSQTSAQGTGTPKQAKAQQEEE